MKILVAVASKHGSTKEIAAAIADELRDHNLDVDRRDVQGVDDLNGYDAVILGSAIYAGNWLTEAKQFAERYQPELATLPVWLFSSGPIGTENPQPDEDPKRLAQPLGSVPVRDHQIFVGKLDLETLSFAERLVVKMVRSPTGDFRDWDRIRAWAQQIARVLLAEAQLKTP